MRLIRRIVIFAALIVVALYLLPEFIPQQDLKKTIVQTAYQKLNIALSVDTVKASFFPTVQLELSKIRFSVKKDTLPFGIQVKGHAEKALVTIALIDSLLSGKILASLALKQPDISINQTATSQDTPSEAVDTLLHSLSLGFEFENANVRLETAEGKTHQFLIKQFQGSSPKLSEFLRVQLVMNIPKTKTEEGAEYSMTIRMISNLNWDLPWTAKSLFTLSLLKLDIENLSYVSPHHHIKQQNNQPISIETKNVTLEPQKANTIPPVVIKVDDHIFNLSGTLGFDPLKFQAELAPFETSFSKFPFHLLQDAFPGAEGTITSQKPLLFSFRDHWQFQLEGLKIQDVVLPLPWLLLEQPRVELVGKVMYRPASALDRPEWSMVQTQAIFPTFSLQWEGTYHPTEKKGSFSLDPIKLDLTQAPSILHALFSIADASGEIHIPSRLFLEFHQDQNKWKTKVLGRILLSEVSGTWNKAYTVQQLTGNTLFGEEKNGLNARISKISNETITIQNVLLNAEGVPQKTWSAKEIGFSINQGQIKLQDVTWDLESQRLTLGLTQVFHNDLPTFLEIFGGGWHETLQGKLRLTSQGLQIPLHTTGFPDWKGMAGTLQVEILNLSWIALPLQSAFSKFFQAYLEKFRVHQVLERKEITEYDSTINTSFAKTTFDISVHPDKDARIQNLSCDSPDENLTGSGTATNLKSLKELSVDINGTFSYRKPTFLYGKLRSILLDDEENMTLPYKISGTLTVPEMQFDQDEMFPRYEEKAKKL